MHLQLVIKQISSVCHDEPPGAQPVDVVSKAELLTCLPFVKTTMPRNHNVPVNSVKSVFIPPPSNPLLVDFLNVHWPPICINQVIRMTDDGSQTATEIGFFLFEMDEFQLDTLCLNKELNSHEFHLVLEALADYQCSCLKKLCFTQGNLQDSVEEDIMIAVRALVRLMEQCTGLEELWICNCGLSASGLVPILNAAQVHPTLCLLDASGNDCIGKDARNACA